MKSNIHFDLKKGNLQNNFMQRDIYQKEKVYQNVQRFCLWYVFDRFLFIATSKYITTNEKKNDEFFSTTSKQVTKKKIFKKIIVWWSYVN